MTDCRVAYRRRTHYATRSNKFKLVRTPGNRLVAQKRDKKHRGPCTPWALGHKRIAGTKALNHFDRRTASKYAKTVSRPYGGVLNGEQVKDRVLRAFLIEEQRIVRKVLLAEAKFQKAKKRSAAKNKRKAERKTAAVKKVAGNRITKKKVETKVVNKKGPIGGAAAAPKKNKK